jgi:hypothetical protein
LEAGFASDAVRLVPGAERDEDEGARAGGLDPHPARVGFFDAIGDLLLPEGDQWAYAEGLRRGGFLVSVHCADVEHDRAVGILDQEGTLDLDEREPLWREARTEGGVATGPAGVGEFGGPALGEIGSTAIGAAGSMATGVSEAASSLGVRQRDETRSRRGTRSFRLDP